MRTFDTHIKFLRKYKWLILIIFVHFLLMNHFFPVVEVFNKDSITNFDYPYFFYKISFLKNLILEGSLSGNNFFFTEGPEDFVYLWDKISLLVVIGLFFIPEVIAFKLYLFVSFLLVPLILYLTARNFNCNEWTCILVSALSVIIWKTHNAIFLYIWSGAYSYIFGSVIAIFSISFLYDYWINKNKSQLIWCFLLMIISLLLHPLSFFVFVIPFAYISYYFLSQSTLSMKKAIPGVLIFSLVARWLFKKPWFYYTHYFKTSLEYSMGPYGLIFDLIHRPIQSLLFISGISSLIFIYKRSFRKNFFLFTALMYLFLGYFGDYIPILNHYKPYRLLVPLSIILIIPISSLLLDYIVFLLNCSKKHMKLNIGLIIMFICFLFVYFYYNYDTRYKIDDEIMSRNINNFFHTSDFKIIIAIVVYCDESFK